jgi:transposase-like protein
MLLSAGHYERKLQTKAGEIKLRIPSQAWLVRF